jgi:hypothetical protein
VIDGDGVRARLIAGRAFGAASPLATASETLYADVRLAAGARVPVEATYEERALYTVAGTIEVAGDAFEPGRLLVLRPGDAITVAATSDARFMLFGGAPMEGPRYIWWNFVSSRPERIEAAKEEWARGRFDTVPGDEAEFIPLPDKRGAPQRAVGGVLYPERAPRPRNQSVLARRPPPCRAPSPACTTSRRSRPAPGERRLLRRDDAAAARQADRQLRRAGHLPPVLRRPGGPRPAPS